MRRIFLDSSVLIAACGSNRGASHAVIVMAEIGLFKIVISEQVLVECDRNITKKLIKSLPIFRNILTATKPEIVADLLPQEIEKWRSIIEPKDAPILAAAISAEVDRILSLNTKDFNPIVAQTSGFIIQTPSQFIQEICFIVTQSL